MRIFIQWFLILSNIFLIILISNVRVIFILLFNIFKLKFLIWLIIWNWWYNLFLIIWIKRLSWLKLNILQITHLNFCFNLVNMILWAWFLKFIGTIFIISVWLHSSRFHYLNVIINSNLFTLYLHFIIVFIQVKSF